MSLDTNLLDAEDKEKEKEEELELAKQEFFNLVDNYKYQQALKYFNNLDAEKRNYITGDKMGQVRLKEAKGGGLGHI